MKRRLLLLLFVVVATAAAAAAAEEVNNSLLNDDAEFPTLDGMLHWAIGHSDPQELRMKAQQHLLSSSSDEVLKRQSEIKQLVEQIPSDAKLMQLAIHDFNNSSLSLEHHRHALNQLSILVEDIHNANLMHQFGGLSLVIRQGLFNNSDTIIRKTCASIIAKASQNNPLVQNQVLELGALGNLLMMLNSTDHIDESVKALYAVSAIIRNNHIGIHSFYTLSGDLILHSILANPTADVRLHKTSLSLVADLAQYHQLNKPHHPSFLNIVTPLIALTTSSDDLHLQEKALLAVKNLLMLKSTQVDALDSFCGLKGALERMMLKLQNLSTEYAIDVAALCKEVNMIYLEKLSNKPDTRDIFTSALVG